jgi:hypothetical protein
VRRTLWEEYRRELISSAGIALILLGNKVVDGDVAPADGVRREFEIALEQGLLVLPVGGSGYVARELWELIMARFSDFFPGADDDVLTAFQNVGTEVDDPMKLMQPILDLIAAVVKE